MHGLQDHTDKPVFFLLTIGAGKANIIFVRLKLLPGIPLTDRLVLRERAPRREKALVIPRDALVISRELQLPSAVKSTVIQFRTQC